MHLSDFTFWLKCGYLVRLQIQAAQHTQIDISIAAASGAKENALPIRRPNHWSNDVIVIIR
jgi:hypothetical protein